MEVVALSSEETESYPALVAFLTNVQAASRASGDGRLASISLPAAALDPLAVLESIYESEEPHFYVERPSASFALAGAEEAIGRSFAGENRFREARGFIERISKSAVAVGDESLPFFGPHFFCAFPFFAEAVEGDAFVEARVFAPKWQVSLLGERCTATANAFLDSESDVEAIAGRIWKANAKFRSFDYRSHAESTSSHPLTIESETEVGATRPFHAAVREALLDIKAGRYDKIVLARALELRADRPFDPLSTLNALRERYPDCFAFSVANGREQSFIGASPERLIKVENESFHTEALAGSAARGRTAAEDAMLGRELLSSVKDRHEQSLVISSVIRCLEAIGLQPTCDAEPILKRLSNVQHLQSMVCGSMKRGTHLLDILEALHPTPAVGGSPRSEAGRRIPELESFRRGLYAAPIGWVDAMGEGEFLVAIRSALVEESTARLYAGVGIVDGSVPERELAETELKFRALKENLR